MLLSVEQCFKGFEGWALVGFPKKRQGEEDESCCIGERVGGNRRSLRVPFSSQSCGCPYPASQKHYIHKKIWGNSFSAQYIVLM